jgi:hypothetical protein
VPQAESVMARASNPATKINGLIRAMSETLFPGSAGLPERFRYQTIPRLTVCYGSRVGRLPAALFWGRKRVIIGQLYPFRST